MSFTSATAEVKGFMAKMAFFRAEKNAGSLTGLFLWVGWFCVSSLAGLWPFFFWVWVCIDVQIGNLRPLGRKVKENSCLQVTTGELPTN